MAIEQDTKLDLDTLAEITAEGEGMVKLKDILVDTTGVEKRLFDGIRERQDAQRNKLLRFVPERFSTIIGRENPSISDAYLEGYPILKDRSY